MSTVYHCQHIFCKYCIYKIPFPEMKPFSRSFLVNGTVHFFFFFFFFLSKFDSLKFPAPAISECFRQSHFGWKLIPTVKNDNFLEIIFIFPRFMDVWTQWVMCKVSAARRGRHVNFARDLLYSFFHESQKNRIHLLYLRVWDLLPWSTSYR